MFLHEFPDIHWLKAQIKTGFENQLSWDGRKLKQPGWPSVILNAKANKVHRENITGPLSFFTNISGNSLVNAGKKELSVNENTFLISNSKQEYSLHIPLQAKTFNIHVGDKLASEVWYYATHSSKYLLDSPKEVFTTIEFHNRVHWRDDYFNALIGKLAHYESETEAQELIGELLLRLADTEIKHQQSANQLKVAKVATREEIIRRLYLAADYI
jgi:AraC family transcriptional regulator